jgi:hypothetical protein
MLLSSMGLFSLRIEQQSSDTGHFFVATKLHSSLRYNGSVEENKVQTGFIHLF